MRKEITVQKFSVIKQAADFLKLMAHLIYPPSFVYLLTLHTKKKINNADNVHEISILDSKTSKQLIAVVPTEV